MRARGGATLVPNSRREKKETTPGNLQLPQEQTKEEILALIHTSWKYLIDTLTQSRGARVIGLGGAPKCYD